MTARVLTIPLLALGLLPLGACDRQPQPAATRPVAPSSTASAPASPPPLEAAPSPKSDAPAGAPPAPAARRGRAPEPPPPTPLLVATLETSAAAFDFGEPPRAVLTLTNLGPRPIELASRNARGVRFVPTGRLVVLDERGRDRGLDFAIEQLGGNRGLGPGDIARWYVPPANQMDALAQDYRRDPRALLPGRYRCRVEFELTNEDRVERLVSNEVGFEVRAADDPGIAVLREVQEGRGVAEHVEFVLEVDPHRNVNLAARNTGAAPVHLGTDWRWEVTDPTGRADLWPNRGRGPGWITIPPGASQLLGSLSLGGMVRDIKGAWSIQVHYHAPLVGGLKSSNTVEIVSK